MRARALMLSKLRRIVQYFGISTMGGARGRRGGREATTHLHGTVRGLSVNSGSTLPESFTLYQHSATILASWITTEHLGSDCYTYQHGTVGFLP